MYTIDQEDDRSLNGRVLVVDDDSVNVKLVTDFLTKQGLNVIAASDGHGALREFARSLPDLVLLDVQMPGIDGFEVCRRLKRNAQSRLVPVIIMTRLSATADRIEGVEAGADDFLTKPISPHELLARVTARLKLKAFTDELERSESVLYALARSIEAKDPYTAGHCDRLSHYAVELGKVIGLSSSQLTALNRAGVVHDVGKVAVPDAILLKPGPLNESEMNVIQQHPLVGERICVPLRSFRSVLPIIRHHHEKLDGTGYPDGLEGSEIPVAALVLQTVDIYDALVTARPYKKALSPEAALTIMEQEVNKGWRDGDIFKEFLGIHDRIRVMYTLYGDDGPEHIECASPAVPAKLFG